jgi:cation transport ATPase
MASLINFDNNQTVMVRSL